MYDARRIRAMPAVVEGYYNEGVKAKQQNHPIDYCPYGKGNPMAMCAWKGGWHDTVYIKPGLLEGEEIILGGDHALRSYA